jgi:hypothetical protein
MRALFGAAALIAIGAAAFFVIRAEKQISDMTASVRRFELSARETLDAFAELRSGQEAYVAAGQGPAFWFPRVSAAAGRAKAGVRSLRLGARSGPGRQSLMEAEATVADLDVTEKRIREYLNAGDRLMAADVIFAEDGNRAAAAAHQVETARLAEHQAADADEAELRRRQAASLAAAAALCAAVIVLLVPARTHQPGPVAHQSVSVDPITAPPTQRERVQSPQFLKIAADLCTEFGRIRDVDDLKRLLAQIAHVMGAKGLIVWLGSTGGTDLHPVLAHGYTAQAIARMPRLRRTSDNAAAAAYRTGVQQIVLSRPGRMCGGIVAPILAVDGCIGALSVEMPEGTEGSEPIQTLATIVASQLANLVAIDAIADRGLRIAE